MIYVSPLIKSAENTDMINSNSGQYLTKSHCTLQPHSFYKKKQHSAEGVTIKLIHISWKSEWLYLSIFLCPAGEDKREVS